MTETDPLAAAQRLEPLVTTLRSRLDRERRLPDELVQTIGDAGLFGMWLPRALGGPERPPLVFMESIEELSRQDGSVGWCTAIAAGHGRFAGALPSHAASDIFGSGRTVLAGTLNPAGKATAVRGGYRVTGRWRYGSVIDHAQWVYGNCVTHDEHGCCRSHGDAPALRLCLFPRAAADVIDTWHVSGLRGTGSHDFAVTDLFVPEDHTVPLPDFTPVPTQPGRSTRSPCRRSSQAFSRSSCWGSHAPRSRRWWRLPRARRRWGRRPGRHVKNLLAWRELRNAQQVRHKVCRDMREGAVISGSGFHPVRKLFSHRNLFPVLLRIVAASSKHYNGCRSGP